MTAKQKMLPGGRELPLSGSEDPNHVVFMQNLLILWDALITNPRWNDQTAKKIWEDYICKRLQYRTEYEQRSPSDEKNTYNKQKDSEKYKDLAHLLLQDDQQQLRKEIADAWAKRWKEDDDEWYNLLKNFRRWIRPSQKDMKGGALRRVGGLSLTRLATITEFRRKVQFGFFTRLQADGSRVEAYEGFGQKSLNDLERLREQRVKQLTSRIVEAALGVGSEDRTHWERQKRPRQRIENKRFAPCHAVIIENLQHYRPEELKTRRENRQLMIWSASRVKKYLKEACELHSLKLHEVAPNYTSRQDSRTGAPGVRCQDVNVTQFLNAGFWKNRREDMEKTDEGKNYMNLIKEYGKSNPSASVRIPKQGAEIFVSSKKDSPASKGLQADFNAAANIGLRALTDPDWAGNWWYVPCSTQNYVPSITGSMVISKKSKLHLADIYEESSENKLKPKAKGKKEAKDPGAGTHSIVNLWREPSTEALEKSKWYKYKEYRNLTEKAVLENLCEILEARLRKNAENERDDLNFQPF